MQAKIGAPSGITSLLDSFGIELSAGDLVVMTDFAKAENAYIHHSTMPVAVVLRPHNSHRYSSAP